MAHRSMRDFAPFLDRPPGLSFHAFALLSRIKRTGSVLHRMSDASKEGVKNGGYLWWLEPSGKRVGPPLGSAELVKNGWLDPLPDSLIDDVAQSFVVRCDQKISV
jgi:hypothetical protein